MKKSCLGRALASVVVVLGVAIGSVGAQAQEEAKRPRGWLRILPVGDAPPFRQKIINGVRVQLADEPGTTPPRKVLIPVDKETNAGITLALGSVSAPVVATVGQVSLSEDRGGGNAAPWAKVQMPEKPAALAIMFRDPRAKLWDRSRSVVVADDTASFPAGATRIVNVSIYSATVVFDGKKHVLKPGQATIRRRAGGQLVDAVLRVAIADGRGGLRRIYDSAVNHARGERTNVVIYRADGEAAPLPAKVLVQRERPSFPALPKRRDKER